MKSTSPFAAFLSIHAARPQPARSVQKTVPQAAKVAVPKPVAKQSPQKPVATRLPRARKTALMPFTDLMAGIPSTGRSMARGSAATSSHQPTHQQSEPASNSTTLARQIVDAGRMARGEIDNPATTSPAADSMAAQIIAAGKRARGEL
ncbi:hypothetical protein KPA96_18340 [Burkholderia cenocepacia]|uniref:hypothetical protein n=1 Tax=Burkholderia cenocepacia TaxID=95486 RepID=UPI002861484B|nr:hypothetical protein [Burkholderia cenocepacia]MDR8077620.1 hypothetical protein [Burkholderia cenocepacia]